MSKIHTLVVRATGKDVARKRLGNSLKWRYSLINGVLRFFYGDEVYPRKKYPVYDAVILGVKTGVEGDDGRVTVRVFEKVPPRNPIDRILWEYGYSRTHVERVSGDTQIKEEMARRRDRYGDGKLHGYQINRLIKGGDFVYLSDRQWDSFWWTIFVKPEATPQKAKAFMKEIGAESVWDEAIDE